MPRFLHLGRAILLAGLFLYPGSFGQKNAKQNASLASQVQLKSAITIHAQKSGFLSAFAHNHVITAPVAQGSVNPQAMSAEIVVITKDMRVLDPEVSEKDRAGIQSTMLGPKVLDAGKFPQIRFQTSRVQEVSPERYRVSGRLELHGVSKDLTFEATGGPQHYQGKTKLKQTDFGIQPVSVAGGTVKVKDELEIEFDLYPADLTKTP